MVECDHSSLCRLVCKQTNCESHWLSQGGYHKVATTVTGVLCLRGGDLCVEQGLAKLHLCKSLRSHEASSNCEATEIVNLICQYKFDE